MDQLLFYPSNVLVYLVFPSYPWSTSWSLLYWSQIEEEFVKVILEVRLWFLLAINSFPDIPDSSERTKKWNPNYQIYYERRI
jgi:hypothetical protein